MAQVLFDPENETRRPWAIERIDMRSPALRKKQRGMGRDALSDLRKENLKQAEGRLASAELAVVRAKAQVVRAKAQVSEAKQQFVLKKRLRFYHSEIERRACRAFGVTRSELQSPRRNKSIVFARQFVMYWSVRLTSHSYPQIGRLIGGRDHTTVIHGCRNYEKKRKAMGRTLRAAR